MLITLQLIAIVSQYIKKELTDHVIKNHNLTSSAIVIIDITS